MKKAKVIDFKGITKLDLDPNRVLKKAVGNLKGAVVIGFDKEGEFYAASSYADGGTVLWLTELLKNALMESK